MIEAGGSLALMEALRSGADDREFERLLAQPDLDRILPVLGIRLQGALPLLHAVADPSANLGLGPEEREVVAYLSELAGRREEFERLVRELEVRETEILDAAFSRTRQLLPSGSSLGPVRLVALPLGYDARTDRQTVYLDPLAGLSLGVDGIIHTLAHEFHHVARYRLTGQNLTLMHPEEDSTPPIPGGIFAEWAAWLEAEGIADSVSNMTEWDVPALRAAADQRRKAMAEYGDTITEVRSRLEAARRLEPRPSPGWIELRRWLLGTSHPVGARMAGEILSHQGPDVLASCVGHPDRFLREYDAAAQSRGAPRFDPELTHEMLS